MAQTLWKQRRLVKAETARLNLELQPQKIVAAVNSELNLSFSSNAISERDLIEMDKNKLAHCEAILHEYETLNLSESFDAAKIEVGLPTFFQELCVGAKLNAVKPEE